MGGVIRPGGLGVETPRINVEPGKGKLRNFPCMLLKIAGSFSKYFRSEKDVPVRQRDAA